MQIPETNDPTDEQLEEAHRIVMEKDPDTLYRVIRALNQESEPEMQKFSAFYLYHRYVSRNEVAPEDMTELTNELGEVYLQFQTPFEQAVDIVEKVDHLAYVHDNDLEWVIDILKASTTGIEEDNHYEFIHDMGIRNGHLPRDKEMILAIYFAWLSQI